MGVFSAAAELFKLLRELLAIARPIIERRAEEDRRWLMAEGYYREVKEVTDAIRNDKNGAGLDRALASHNFGDPSVFLDVPTTDDTPGGDRGQLSPGQADALAELGMSGEQGSGEVLGGQRGVGPAGGEADRRPQAGDPRVEGPRQGALPVIERLHLMD